MEVLLDSMSELTGLTHGCEEEVGGLGWVEWPEDSHQLGQEVVVITTSTYIIVAIAAVTALKSSLWVWGGVRSLAQGRVPTIASPRNSWSISLHWPQGWHRGQGASTTFWLSLVILVLCECQVCHRHFLCVPGCKAVTVVIETINPTSISFTITFNRRNHGLPKSPHYCYKRQTRLLQYSSAMATPHWNSWILDT